jgi:hypothetical protein
MFVENGRQAFITTIVSAAKDTSNECIKIRNTHDILWRFIHQSVKGDAVSQPVRSGIRTSTEQMNCCFTWISTESTLGIRNPL